MAAIVAVGALVVAGAVPASAVASSWTSGDHFTYLGNCPVKSSNYSRWAYAQKQRSCPGYVGVRAKIASGGRITYTNFTWDSRSARLTLPSGARTLSHQSGH